MNEMRILTVRQPWASTIIHLRKNVENRSRNIAGDWRGAIAIHAGLAQPGRLRQRTDYGQGLEVEKDQAGLLLRSDRLAWPYRLPLGCIIGVVDLVGVHRADPDEHGQIRCRERARYGTWARSCSDWAQATDWHLELANPRPLAEPIPYRGALGLRRLPDDVADAVWKAVAS